jgi:hypothetical protein
MRKILPIDEALSLTQEIPEVYAILQDRLLDGYDTVEISVDDDGIRVLPVDKQTGPTSDSVHVPTTDWRKKPSHLAKAEVEEERYTFSPWYVPDVVDAHGEWTDPREVQHAFWRYLANEDRDIRLQHNTDIVAGRWVEGATWPYEVEVEVKHPEGEVQYTFPAGTPFLGIIWEPWAWELIKSGEIRGLSIGGTAQRAELELSKLDYAPTGTVEFTKETPSTGDFVSWNSSGGRARGKIDRIVRDGVIKVPNSNFTITGDEDNPAALITVWREFADGWKATDTKVGHKLSTLTTISSLNKNLSKHLSGRHDQSSHARGSGKYPRVADRPASSDRSPEAVKAAIALRGATNKQSDEITDTMTGIASSVGGKLVGLEYRVKSTDSLARKIDDDSKKLYNGDTDLAASKISDASRYTMVLDDAKYTDGLAALQQDLVADGYEIRTKNFWQEGDSYQGVNIKVTKNGVVSELQVHTPKSYEIKETRLHPVYEEFRVSADPAVRASLYSQMVSIAATIPKPNDYDTLLSLGEPAFQAFTG